MVKARRAASGTAASYRKLFIGIAVVIVVGVACAAVATIGVVRSRGVVDPQVSPATGDPPSDSMAGLPSRSPNNPAEIAAAVNECGDQVLLAENVIAAADTGIGHWHAHVQAQTDFYAGRITDLGMAEIFKSTRNQGPADKSAWVEAKAAWKSDPDVCRPIDGAVGSQAAVLADCAIRLSALEQALPAASTGMTDWLEHLADEHHSDEVADPEQAWFDAWKAAPRNIKQWQSTQKELAELPECKA